MLGFKRSDPAQTVFGDWAGKHLVLTGHVVRRSELDSIGPLPASTMFWIGPEPDSTKIRPVSQEGMSVLTDRLPGEDVAASVRRLHSDLSVERLERMRKQELQALLALGLARLEHADV